MTRRKKPICKKKSGTEQYDPEVCGLHCEAAAAENGDDELIYIEGRVRTLEAHLRKCEHYELVAKSHELLMFQQLFHLETTFRRTTLIRAGNRVS